jgi:hypothetical protein
MRYVLFNIEASRSSEGLFWSNSLFANDRFLNTSLSSVTIQREDRIEVCLEPLAARPALAAPHRLQVVEVLGDLCGSATGRLETRGESIDKGVQEVVIWVLARELGEEALDPWLGLTFSSRKEEVMVLSASTLKSSSRWTMSSFFAVSVTMSVRWSME